jgi:CsoR family transcriptional regulator, copper-sensing transcriptional repressor
MEGNTMNEHNHPQSKAVVNRLSRLIGHLESIKKMTEEGRDCSEILIQISAVRSALNNVGKIILEDHINNCVVEAIENNNKQVLDSLLEAIDKFVGTNSINYDGTH